MKPRTILLGIIILAAAAFALLLYNTYDNHSAEQTGVGLSQTN